MTNNSTKNHIDAALNTLWESPTLCSMISDDTDFLSSVTIQVDDKQTYAGYYDAGQKLITLRPDMDFPLTLGTIIHELRHAYQDKIGLLHTQEGESAEANELLMEADVAAFEITVAHELRSKFPELWKSYADYSASYSNLCNAFSRAIDGNNENFDNGEVANAIFAEYLSDKGFREAYLEKTETGHPLPEQRSVLCLRKYFNARLQLCIPSQTKQSSESRYLHEAYFNKILMILVG